MTKNSLIKSQEIVTLLNDLWDLGLQTFYLSKYVLVCEGEPVRALKLKRPCGVGWCRLSMIVAFFAVKAQPIILVDLRN